MSREIQILCDTRTAIGESPVWSVQEQALYWVDIEGQKIHRANWLSRAHQSWSLPERVGCIALSTRSTVIAAMETGVFEVALKDNTEVQMSCLAKVDHPAPGMRFNDGRCDAKGRFWISTMCRDMSLASTVGGIYCLDAGGLRGPVLGGYITPNGMAFNNDATVGYLSDSHPTMQKIWKHTFDLVNGQWGPKTAWVDMTSMPGRPDGAAVDTEGCYWVCANDAGMVHRFSPAGALLNSIHFPASKPSMCAFGGPELRHLFVASIKPANPVEGFHGNTDGAVFVVETDAQGLPEPMFSQFPHSLVP